VCEGKTASWGSADPTGSELWVCGCLEDVYPTGATFMKPLKLELMKVPPCFSKIPDQIVEWGS
jgi:hypothetical protein